MKPFLGVLALDTAFPRILGDAGNALSYDFPVRIKVVKGVESLAIVKDELIAAHLAENLCDVAKKLETEGAIAITSTCGFLISVQSQIADAVSIPVMVSALSLFPFVDAISSGKPIGILTASKHSLCDIAKGGKYSACAGAY